VLSFLFAVIVIYFSEKKRETKFLLAAILFIYSSGTHSFKTWPGRSTRDPADWGWNRVELKKK
jgi:hypothetical protein